MLHGVRPASLRRFPAPPVSAVLRKTKPETPGSCRGGSLVCVHCFICYLRCTCRMPCRARPCEARARSRSASGAPWHALPGSIGARTGAFFLHALFLACLAIMFLICMPHAIQKIYLPGAQGPMSGPVRATHLRHVLT